MTDTKCTHCGVQEPAPDKGGLCWPCAYAELATELARVSSIRLEEVVMELSSRLDYTDQLVGEARRWRKIAEEWRLSSLRHYKAGYRLAEELETPMDPADKVYRYALEVAAEQMREADAE